MTLDNQENFAFAVLREVIKRFDMATLYNTELPMLKLLFYQLDRLISILLPDLHNHFKDETINSSYFSSPFFFTLFTNVIQTLSSFRHAWLMQRVWDHFLVHGWKTVFKVSILILKSSEETMLTMSFEMLVAQMMTLPSKFLIGECIDIDKKYEKMLEEANAIEV